MAPIFDPEKILSGRQKFIRLNSLRITPLKAGVKQKETKNKFLQNLHN